jgi:hypothetical protein
VVRLDVVGLGEGRGKSQCRQDGGEGFQFHAVYLLVGLGLGLLLRGDDAEFDLHVVGDGRGVLPLAFADVELQALDRQHAFEDLLAASALKLTGATTSRVMPLMVSLPAASNLPGAGRLDGGGDEGRLGELGGVEPFRLDRLAVEVLGAEVEAGDVDLDAGAFPSAGLAGSKLTCAVKRLNLPSTGTPICFETATTLLFAASSWASAGARRAAPSARAVAVFFMSFLSVEEGDHAAEHLVAVDEVVLERRRQVGEHQRRHGEIEDLVHRRSMSPSSLSLVNRSGRGIIPRYTVWKPLAELISQPETGTARIST